MGHRGIYTVAANGERASFYTHWGVASPFSIFRRLLCALELKEGNFADKSIVDIFSNLGESGEYLYRDGGDRMFEILSVRDRRRCIKDFNSAGYLEMRVTLNFDTNTAFLEHNPRYCHYKYVGNYFIPLDEGIHNIKAVLDYSREIGLDDVIEIAELFHQKTGMADVYKDADQKYRAEKEAEKGNVNPHKQSKYSTFGPNGQELMSYLEDDGLER